MMNYAQPLRAIGQALELLDIDHFDVEPHGKYFLVAWRVARASHAVEPIVDYDIVRRVWGIRPDQSFSDMGLNDLDRTKLELHYSAEDIERLDRADKAQRQSGQITTNDTRLSQLLRAVGAYLNQKDARLVRISKSGESVTVEFKTARGEAQEQQFTFSELAEISLRMYSRRAKQTLH